MNEHFSHLEEHVVEVIENGLRERQIDATRAKSIAAAVLTGLKTEMSEFELYQAAAGLGNDFPELHGIAAEAGELYEDRIREAVVQHVNILMKQGNLEGAAALLSAALTKNQEVKIDG